MSDELKTVQLTEKQMNDICSAVSAGCDLITAAGVAECEVIDLARALDTLQRFAIRMRHAEATAELQHMTNILKAATTSDGRFWRASVWWLEHRAPERFARRPAGAITPAQLKQAILTLNDMLQLKLDSPADQQRINDSLTEIIESIEIMLDGQTAAAVLKRTEHLRLEHDASHDAQVAGSAKTKSPHESAQP